MKARTGSVMVGTLLALMWSAPVLAQGFYVGARAGWTRTYTTLELSTTRPDNVGHRNSVHGGILAGYNFNPTFAFQAEVLWSGQGFKTTDTIPFAVPSQADTALVLEWRLNYIQVPLLAVATIAATNNVNLRLMGGISIGFETSCKVKLQGVAGDTNCEDNPPTRTKKKVDVGIPLGVGVGLGLGSTQRTQLFFDVGYTIGLSNVSAVVPGGSTAIKLKNQLLAATFGVSFRLGS